MATRGADERIYGRGAADDKSGLVIDASTPHARRQPAVRNAITVRTLAFPVRSGVFGGAVPEALIASIKILAALHDDEGNIIVPDRLWELRRRRRRRGRLPGKLRYPQRY